MQHIPCYPWTHASQLGIHGIWTKSLGESLTPCVGGLFFSDDQQTQNSSLGLFPNANLVVSGGTFVSLSPSLRNHLIIIVHRLTPRTIMSIITLLVLVKSK